MAFKDICVGGKIHLQESWGREVGWERHGPNLRPADLACESFAARRPSQWAPSLEAGASEKFRHLALVTPSG